MTLWHGSFFLLLIAYAPGFHFAVSASRLTPKDDISVLVFVGSRGALGTLGRLGVFFKAILSRRLSFTDITASSMRIAIPRIVL